MHGPAHGLWQSLWVHSPQISGHNYNYRYQDTTTTDWRTHITCLLNNFVTSNGICIIWSFENNIGSSCSWLYCCTGSQWLLDWQPNIMAIMKYIPYFAHLVAKNPLKVYQFFKPWDQINSLNMVPILSATYYPTYRSARLYSKLHTRLHSATILNISVILTTLTH